MKTYPQFIEAYNLEATFEFRGRHNVEEWANYDQWLVTIKRQSKQMGLLFYTGRGIKQVDLPMVLECLASDSRLAEDCRGISDLKDELGCSWGESQFTWALIRKYSASLKRFLGDDLYTELLREVD